MNRYGFRCPRCNLLLDETSIVRDKELAEKHPRLLKQFVCPRCGKAYYFQDLEEQTLLRFTEGKGNALLPAFRSETA